MSGRIVRHAGLAGMVLVALVLSHNLAFLAAYRGQYAAALAAAGHGAAWNGAVAIVLALGSGLVAAAAWRLRRLGILARAATSGPPMVPPDRAALRRHLARLWAGLSLVTTVLFVVQENVERWGNGQPLPGLGVLAGEGVPLALPIIAAVAFIVALVAALFRSHRDVLLARIRAGRRPRRRATVVRRTASDGLDHRLGSLLGHGLAVRAPPAGVTNRA